jgi:ribosome-associated protein
MGEDIHLIRGLRIPASEIQISFARSGGPGGQNVNKVASKAVLRWNVASSSLPAETKSRIIEKLESKLTNTGDLLIAASEYRDAPRNADAARSRLQAVINAALHVPRKRRPGKPGRGAVERRLQQKHRHSDRKRERRKADDSQ